MSAPNALLASSSNKKQIRRIGCTTFFETRSAQWGADGSPIVKIKEFNIPDLDQSP
jgi:hypothetical protein